MEDIKLKYRVNQLNQKENFKIFEYFDYTIILPLDGKYDQCIVFFAGFNENASKYTYLFKLYFESFENDLKIKFIIPMSNRYTRQDYELSPKLSKYDHITDLYSWFIYDKEKITLSPRKEKDDFIFSLVQEEIKKLGSSEKIILSAFSLGGRYLMHFITTFKIKTKFNLIFKTIIPYFENPYKESLLLDDKKFNENIFHFFFSRFDKVVGYENIVSTFQQVSKSFKNCEINFDNGKKHLVDYNCLEYLRKLLLQYSPNYKL